MRVEFDYSIDDIVDVQMRLLKRSRAAKAWRWRDLVLTALFTGVLLFAVIPEGITGKLIVACIGLLVAAVLYPVLNEITVKKRLRKWFEENAGSDKSFTIEVELNQSGVHTRSNGTRIIYDWENVTEIKETEDSVDIYSERGGLVVVRKRAFASPGDQQRFIDLAEQFLKMAHESPQPNRAI